MKKLIQTFVFLLFLFSFFDVNAVEKCTSGELKRLKELTNNIKFTYKYNILDVPEDGVNPEIIKMASFDVKAHNLSDEVIVRLKEYPEIEFTKEKPEVDNFINGEIFKVEMVAYTKNLCSGRVITTKTIKLPTFNLLSLNDECKLYSDFKYCSEYGNFKINNLEFSAALEKYKKSLEEEEQNKDNDDKIDKNKNDIKNNYLFYIGISSSLILVFGVILIIYQKKKRDSDL